MGTASAMPVVGRFQSAHVLEVHGRSFLIDRSHVLNGYKHLARVFAAESPCNCLELIYRILVCLIAALARNDDRYKSVQRYDIYFIHDIVSRVYGTVPVYDDSGLGLPSTAHR